MPSNDNFDDDDLTEVAVSRTFQHAAGSEPPGDDAIDDEFDLDDETALAAPLTKTDDFDEDDTSIVSRPPAMAASRPDHASRADHAPRPEQTDPPTRSLRDRVPEAPLKWEPPARPRSPEFETAAQRAASPFRSLMIGSVLLVLAAALVIYLAWRNDVGSTETEQPEQTELIDAG